MWRCLKKVRSRCSRKRNATSGFRHQKSQGDRKGRRFAGALIAQCLAIQASALGDRDCHLVFAISSGAMSEAAAQGRAQRQSVDLS